MAMRADERCANINPRTLDGIVELRDRVFGRNEAFVDDENLPGRQQGCRVM